MIELVDLHCLLGLHCVWRGMKDETNDTITFSKAQKAAGRTQVRMNRSMEVEVNNDSAKNYRSHSKE